MTDSEVILRQAKKIERLEQQVAELQDTQFKRNQWLTQAKNDAGYPPYTSFDEVWDEALQALKEKKQKDK